MCAIKIQYKRIFVLAHSQTLIAQISVSISQMGDVMFGLDYLPEKQEDSVSPHGNFL